MADTLTPDLCIIGAGAGGLALAQAAAGAGASVVLVEQGRMGGERLNTGCIPSKALLAATRRFHDLKSLGQFGIGVANTTIDFAEARAHMRGVIAAVAPNDSAERLTGLGVRVIVGTARFTDPDTVTAGNDVTIKAHNTVIATGSSPTHPLIHGLEPKDYYTSKTIFDLTECPDHLVILGGGSTGIELAQAFRRFGAAVTVIEMRRPLATEDAECADIVLAQLDSEGIAIQPGALVTGIEHRGTGVKVTLDTDAGTRTIEGSHLLVAVGCWPNVDGLDLAAAGVRHNAGGITVDAHLRTSNKKIYAVGDVTGGPRFTHVAQYHAGIVLQNTVLKGNAKVDYSATPRVLFSDPELAQVGLTEAEAVKQRHRIRVLRWGYVDNDRAQAEHTTRGHIKVVTDLGGNILGATIVGSHAGELISVWTLAITQHIDIHHMAQLVVPYPTLAEIGKSVAGTSLTTGLTTSWLQRIMGSLRRRG
jgi:pyruvate/2-oxoglutarate dehydrogenase complex dihydrolipoamide dehydrogenase (E3) component